MKFEYTSLIELLEFTSCLRQKYVQKGNVIEHFYYQPTNRSYTLEIPENT